MPNSSKKAENAIEATEKTPTAEISVPAAVETTPAAEALTETEKASKTDATKKRGRKPSASKAAAPAAKKEKTTASKAKKPAAAEKEPVTEVKAEAPKDETPKKRGRKPAAPKAAAPAPAAKKEKSAASRSKKAAAAKKENAAEVKAEVQKTDAPKKRGRKPAAAKSKTPAGKGGRKKSVTRDAIIDAAKKRMKTADISKIKYPIALNLEINNFDGEDNKYVYILISDGNIKVEPYRYNDYDFSFRGDAENILNVMNGKTNIYDAFANGLIKIDGNNIKKAILFINAAF